jgi:dihydrofolate reductase
MEVADELCITEIDSAAPEADAYFPEIKAEVWKEKSRDAHPVDEKHLCPYAFVDYERR